MSHPCIACSCRSRKTCHLLSGWATKVNDVGQQALLGTKRVEESECRKGFGIHKASVPSCSGDVVGSKPPLLFGRGCRFKTAPLLVLKVSKDLELETDLTNTSGKSASRAMPNAKLPYCLQLDCTNQCMPVGQLGTST